MLLNFSFLFQLPKANFYFLFFFLLVLDNWLLAINPSGIYKQNFNLFLVYFSFSHSSN